MAPYGGGGEYRIMGGVPPLLRSGRGRGAPDGNMAADLMICCFVSTGSTTLELEIDGLCSTFMADVFISLVGPQFVTD
jgi:hypothetical protein